MSRKVERLFGAGQKTVLWFLFVLICGGLGYPTVNRYDPRQAGGVSDSAEYYSLIVSPDWASGTSLDFEVPRPRILVPLVARVINSIVEGHTRPVDPVLLSLLIANAMFCATAALILIELGARVTGNYTVALLAATLYLLNFAVSNYLLSDMVDSAEACLMLALAWALHAGRLFLLPVIGIIGACAKETFVPLSAAFTMVWWLFAAPAGRNASNLGWIAGMDVLALSAMFLLWSSWYGQPVWPWNIAMLYHSGNDATFLQGLWGCITSRGVLYVFAWLVPLGVWKLNRLPIPWVAASLATALLALAMGAWENGAGNIARAMFNAIAPALSLSVALLLSGSGKNLSTPEHRITPKSS